MKKEDIKLLIAEALETQSENLSDDAGMDNTDGWDSLGHLSILQALSNKFGDAFDSIPEISSATSLRQIYQKLEESGLLEDN